MSDETFARIRLLRSPNVGPVSYRQLLQRYGTAQAALEVLPGLTTRAGMRYELAGASAIAAEITRMGDLGAHYLFHDSPHYPALLAASEHAPPILCYRGDLELLDQPAVAMVGARNCSAAAVRIAHGFAATLAAEGLAVVSGMARGIDAAAHRGALAGMGQGGGTIAAIAGGIDQAYPPENADLQEQVARAGLVLAEMPPGTEPQGRHFPRRNRIIAGIAIGTVVVEAAPRSGSLITARLAADLGREVMAVPGSPLDPRSHGCNQLIRDGATLVQVASDIAEVIAGFTGSGRARLAAPAGAAYAVPAAQADSDEGAQAAPLDGLLSHAPVAVDELVRQSGGTAGAVQLALLELELTGQITRHAGGRVSLV